MQKCSKSPLNNIMAQNSNETFEEHNNLQQSSSKVIKENIDSIFSFNKDLNDNTLKISNK